MGCALMTFSAAALADGDVDNDVLQKLLGNKTGHGKPSIVDVRPVEDDSLRLTTNKDKIIRLDQDAASVIVNNPEHAAVLLDSPRLLIVMPRQPGATSFSVLDNAGNVILKKEIIVTNVQPHYVRIRRMCNGGGDCAPVSYFYCPDGCFEVTAVNGGTGAIGVPPPASQPAPAAKGGDDILMDDNAPAPKAPAAPAPAPAGTDKGAGTPNTGASGTGSSDTAAPAATTTPVTPDKSPVITTDKPAPEGTKQ
jgi:hypothetical protein